MGNERRLEILGILLVALSMFLLVSQLGYNPNEEPTISPNIRPTNPMGILFDGGNTHNDTSRGAMLYDIDYGLAFKSGGAVRWKIDEAGDIIPYTSFSGIVLGATSNVDANTLDDYEEGSFTPAFNGNPGGTGYHGATGGSYVKVGRKVSFNIYIAMTSWVSSSTHLVISGLPFASGTATSGSDVLYGGAYPSYIANMNGGSTIDMGHIGSQSPFIGLYYHVGGSIANVSGSGHSNNFAIIVNGHYFTN